VNTALLIVGGPIAERLRRRIVRAFASGRKIKKVLYRRSLNTDVERIELARCARTKMARASVHCKDGTTLKSFGLSLCDRPSAKTLGSLGLEKARC